MAPMPECFAIAGALSVIITSPFETFPAEPGRSFAHADTGEGTENAKDVQKPQYNGNDHNGIQDRLNGARHGDKTVDEPENNTNHDQDYYHVN